MRGMQNEATASESKRRLNWKRLFKFWAIVGCVSVPIFLYDRRKRELEYLRKRNESMKAALGGEIELIDENGRLTSTKEFLGKWILIYFGYTHCPDICPEEMEKMCTVVDLLEKNKNIFVQPIFITVDPKRDTTEIVQKYVKEFSPKIKGFTGSKDQIEAAMKAYRVYSGAMEKDEYDEYVVDHTIITYLINPVGEFVDYYGRTKNAQQMFNSVSKHIENYAALQKKSWLQLFS
ncbi:hypothetical protein B4U79_03272 [Dinothrombium tinctorium]|uniref:Protein SCO1-like protein n=1 Tax=Dinothrombium tinctorium TaxID=1965070 RepID=A0A443R373_9ACAR|nr:hypothetical protein B4U79_02234 [Dinothrombium tinctorium]RWS09725.1 hypothetical protein B4U79_09828 [Dinothrombium tinctorium]RWS09945.1 hypothetical protein B4U79_03272 [Dinothrombium tinctorium]